MERRVLLFASAAPLKFEKIRRTRRPCINVNIRLKKEGSFVYSDASELFQTDLNTFIILDKLPDFVNNKVEKSDNELFVILEVLLLG